MFFLLFQSLFPIFVIVFNCFLFIVFFIVKIPFIFSATSNTSIYTFDGLNKKTLSFTQLFYIIKRVVLYQFNFAIFNTIFIKNIKTRHVLV